jgi:hypothetical protein
MMKLLEENIVGRIHNIGMGKDFLDKASKGSKSSNRQMKLHQPKGKHTYREAIFRVKRYHIEGRYLQIIYLTRG